MVGVHPNTKKRISREQELLGAARMRSAKQRKHTAGVNKSSAIVAVEAVKGLHTRGALRDHGRTQVRLSNSGQVHILNSTFKPGLLDMHVAQRIAYSTVVWAADVGAIFRWMSSPSQGHDDSSLMRHTCHINV